MATSTGAPLNLDKPVDGDNARTALAIHIADALQTINDAFSPTTGHDHDGINSRLIDAMSNPMTAAGDIIVGGVDGEPTRLPKGTAGQVPQMNSEATAPEWVTHPTGHNVAAQVHGLPANVSVLGNRNASGEFIQRGYVTVDGEQTNDGGFYQSAKAVTFPVAFTAIQQLLVSPRSTNYYWCVPGDITTTGFRAMNVSTVSGRVVNQDIAWLAIGS